MTQTTNNLNDTFGLGDGVTPNFKISYDDSLSQADGEDRANALMAVCDGDYAWIESVFGGIALVFALPLSLQIAPGAYASAGWGPGDTPITLTPGDGQKLDLVRYLVVSEVTEMFMQTKDNGWGYSFGDGNEGSKGEGLSRFLGYDFLSSNGLDTTVLKESGGTFFVSNDWLASGRADFVNDNPDDNHPDATTGCTTLFIYYLNAQLGFTAGQIIDNGGKTLADVYTHLTGDAGNPFPFFSRLLENAFPGTSTITTGPNFDNPFPLGLLSFWVDKSTFGRDEAQDIIDAQGGLVSNAFYLVLEGFTIDSFNQLNITIPAPTGGFAGATGITISATPATPGLPAPANPIPEFEDPANPTIPQRIRFSFDIRFSSLAAFPAPGGNPATFELDAVANVGGNPLAGARAATDFELLPGEDPYFTNIDPSNASDAFYLSQDLRVFSVTAGTAPLSGAPAFTNDPYSSIQSLIGYLNSTPGYTNPSAADPLDALPGQIGFETADSSVTPVNAAHEQNYNFAVARVRLRGTAGASADAVRVFFRLFVAQSCDTDFQPATTYASTLGSSGSDNGRPIFPLASGTGLVDPTGQSIQTIPYFATDASGTHDYDGTFTNGNIRTLLIPNGQDVVWAYFGCFLDVYDANHNSKFGGTHHCLVAQIAYDQAPIPTATSTGATPSPANSDKLAQRNLQITLSENPKSPATHRIPQAFDLRPSRPVASQPGALLDYPDELMIDWGRTPVGSAAYIYWPQMSASEVLDLANGLYSSHLLSIADAATVQCATTAGVTYIPIPLATAVNLAGLFTVDLPSTVRERERFDIVVRRITTRRLITKEPARLQAKSTRTRAQAAAAMPRSNVAGVARPTNWRQVVGAFQVRIPVTNREVMLPLEESALAVIKWRLKEMAPMYRWRPVLERYLEYVAARVDGLGGDSGAIPPSLSGAPTEPMPCRREREHECNEHTGKLEGLIYDRFGDFEGFVLRTEAGGELTFYSHETEVEHLVRQAWVERYLITVCSSHRERDRPIAITLGRRHDR